MLLRRFCLAFVFCLASVSSALAQNWSFDARSIALGSVSGKDNLASRMVDEQRHYKSIVIPLGLFQVLRDFDRFKPESDEFDLVRAIEYSASPLHYQFGRDQESASGTESVHRHPERDRQPRPERLSRLQAGETARGRRSGQPVVGRDDPRQRRARAVRSRASIVGAGPYLSMRERWPRSIRESSTSLTATTALRFHEHELSARQRPFRARSRWRSPAATAGALPPTGGRIVTASMSRPTTTTSTASATNTPTLLLRLDTDAAGTADDQSAPAIAAVDRAHERRLRHAASPSTSGWRPFSAASRSGSGSTASRIGLTGQDVEQTTYLLGNLFLGRTTSSRAGRFRRTTCASSCRRTIT